MDASCAKRAKVCHSVEPDEEESERLSFLEVQSLLLGTREASPPAGDAPTTKIGNSVKRARTYFDRHGFRTAIVESPRVALSIYRNSCVLSANDYGNNHQHHNGGSDCEPHLHYRLEVEKKFLLAMLGCRQKPDEQERLEFHYASTVRQLYCLLLYCKRLREACRRAIDVDVDLQSLIRESERDCRALCVDDDDDGVAVVDFDKRVQKTRTLSDEVVQRIAKLNRAVIKADPSVRPVQLQHEFDRIVCQNSTYANANLGIWLRDNNTNVKEIYFKRSPVPKYERITMYMYDDALDAVKPSRFTWMPCLTLAVQQGPEAVAAAMTYHFWEQLLRRGYYATESLQKAMSPDLEKFFLSGISRDTSLPLILRAHFTPTHPLCFYFHGKAGSGKSSLVRNFAPALQSTVEQFCDPEMLVRFVKQNLNKSQDTLQLELELRPNNNDLSVMSIIQGRRMTMGQSKPGLVVVGLEEMPSNRPGADPNQLSTSQLISQRFSGRKGEYNDREPPINSSKRGISGDASIIPLFTSNYDLEETCLGALSKLRMFSDLKVVHVKAVAGRDRECLAMEYLLQSIRDFRPDVDLSYRIQLEIPLGEGDTRPLVRMLRMIAFYVNTLLPSQQGRLRSALEISVSQRDHRCGVQVGTESIDLKVTASENLVPMCSRVSGGLVSVELESLNEQIVAPSVELTLIINFWFSKTLEPAVVVSTDRQKISCLMDAVRALENVKCINSVDASQYKMMKSLYDRSDTPNLRDDILKYGCGARVAIELVCPTADAQLCIREIIEDTPSLTAFSTEASALFKSGLLFCVHVEGDVTPEVMSRASLII